MVMVPMNSHVLDPQSRMLPLQHQHAAELASFEQYGDRTLRNQVRVVRRHRCRRPANPLNVWRIGSFYASGDTHAVLGRQVE